MKRAIVLICLIALVINTNGQSQTEIANLKKLNKPTFHKPHYPGARKSKDNEFQLLASRLFLFYKHFISSQDATQCSFTPSCSVYAIRAIQQQGFLLGIINFFDRYTTCNNLSPERYPRHPETHLLYDPVD